MNNTNRIVYVSGYVNTTAGKLKIAANEGVVAAKTLAFFDQLFDSVNGHTTKMETPLRVAVSERSKHHEFWPEAREKLKLMQFVDKDHIPVRAVPTLTNWVRTIDGFIKLWPTVQKAGFDHLKTRFVNQDPLENFFGSIRSQGGSNTSPSCYQFGALYKTLLINNLTSPHSVGSNCEKACDGKLLFSLSNLILTAEQRQRTAAPANDEDSSLPPEEIVITDESLTLYCNDTEAALSLVKKICRNVEIINCESCRKAFFIEESVVSNFSPGADKSAESLTSSCLNPIFLENGYFPTISILRNYLPQVCSERNLNTVLQRRITDELHFEWAVCDNHQDELIKIFVNSIVKSFVTTWCQRINAILSGRDTQQAAIDQDRMVAKAIKKCNSKSKTK